ncbi:MAG: MerR family transcriptional regulator [Chitinophagaceae bacterium]
MGKQLSQITFDFIAPEENDNISVTAPPVTREEKPTATAIEEIITVKEPVMSIKKEKPVSARGRRSLKDTDSNLELVNVPPDEILFQKQYYSIGEVAVMFRENQSLIRYWETEFDILQPRKNRKGDRFFRPVDIKNLVMIYDLLRRRKFTIEGAKDYLKKNKKAEQKFTTIQSLEKIKGFLLELKANL